MALRFLVVEGNDAAGREAYAKGFGKTASEAYADALFALAPDADCELLNAADAGAHPSAALADYDGVFITGSALNLYDGGPAIERQIELARAVFAARTPFFGSCWGLQVAAAAAGGRVLKNPRGREVGIARGIWLNAAGLRHPMLTGRAPAYEALCTHLDIVELPPGGVVLASNDLAPVQAAEISFQGGLFWGVQYHPEYDFAELAAIVARRAGALAREGFARDEQAARAYAEDLLALDREPAPADVAWRIGATASATTKAARRLELANFIERRVRPEKSARGRA
jgi:GMP synthase (glutamine-hydrolysing)